MRQEFDVIVVGGLACAMSAAEHGSDVLVLEKQPKLGGATGIAIGSFTVNRTSIQKKAGVATFQMRLHRHGGTLLCDARVEELVREGERVCGVIARIDGRKQTFRARCGVVLAAGDYANAPDMIGRFRGERFSVVEGINPHARGRWPPSGRTSRGTNGQHGDHLRPGTAVHHSAPRRLRPIAAVSSSPACTPWGRRGWEA